MRIFGAMMLDSYRELNSKKLFWITLILSAIVVLAFAAVGLDPKGVTVFGWTIPVRFLNSNTMEPALFYKSIFINLGINIWLAWVATILALVSTAGIIPEFVSSGSIDLCLSKPIARTKLFIYKYISCLLFTGLQVFLFCAASFLVIGLRGDAWVPGIFLAIPLVVIFYSYLFCICALLGMITRSAIASLLLTLLFWFFLFAMNATDGIFVMLKSDASLRVEAIEAKIIRMEKSASKALEDGASQPDAPQPPFTTAQLDAKNLFLPPEREKLTRANENKERWTFWASTATTVKTFFPKSSETIEVLERRLVSETEMEKFAPPDESRTIEGIDEDDVQISQRESSLRAASEFRSRPLWWVIGTSLGFECVILGVACIIFWRRDF